MTITTNKNYHLNYLNGEWIESASEEIIESINPANTREIVGSVQGSTLDDLNKAVESAENAKKSWRKLGQAARGSYLYKVADILEENIIDIAETMTKEMGKTFQEAKGETTRGVAILRYYAGEGMRKNGDVIPSSDSKALMFTSRTPLGVVGVITPWNFPVAIPIWKIAPALVYGNTVIFKPATEAAVTAAKIIQCFEKAELPKGVINFVTGSGSVIGQGIINHKSINGITFTGSDKTGKLVGEGANKRGAKYQLELGGKNPVIITKEANIEKAVEGVINGGLRSTGQKCTSTSRVVIEEEIYDLFKDRLLEKVKDLKVGLGLEDETWMGPCSSKGQLDTVKYYIQKGKEEGADLIYGGDIPQGKNLENGYFINPTIFENVRNDMTIAQEEIFGPVLALIKVKDFNEAVEVANDTEYGLSASIYTENIENMLNFIDDIEAGLVRVNAESAGVELQAPFGGMKGSSVGSREQGEAAKEFYTSIKTVFIKS